MYVSEDGKRQSKGTIPQSMSQKKIKVMQTSGHPRRKKLRKIDKNR